MRTNTQLRVQAASREGAGTDVSDTAASYTQPRKGGKGHGSARHRGVIPPGPAALFNHDPQTA